MDIVVGTYKLTPYGSERCWEMWEWRPERVAEKGRNVGGTVEAGWVSLGRYPGTLEYGLKMLAEQLLMAKSGEAQNVAEIAVMVSEVKKDIIDALRFAYDAIEGV